MPRKSRVVVPGLSHHVTQRGNYKQTIFEGMKDFQRYFYLYEENAKKYKVKTLAYCLMKNHVHFIIVPETENGLARLFNSTHMRYSQYVHRKKKKKGHLWQGRFFSCVLSPGHLYRAVRYVEQNPVRAQIVSKPWDYIWSSAKQHIGNEMEPIIKTEDAMNVLDIYGRVENWKSYLEEEDVHMLGEIRRVTHKGLALGSKEFVLNLEKKIGLRLRELKAGRPLTLKK